MTKVTTEKMLEKESEGKFKEYLHPWDAHRTENDFGIDLIVHPLHEDGRPRKSTFKVQLKSTNEKCTSPKAVIEKAHIEQWANSDLKVMLAKYYKDEQVFYFEWITNETLNQVSEQKSLTIHLHHKLCKESSDQKKTEIIKFIEPLCIEYGSIIPSIGEKGYEASRIAKVDSFHDHDGLLTAFNAIHKKTKKEFDYYVTLKNLNSRLEQNQYDPSLLFQKAQLLLALKQSQEALMLLDNLNKKFGRPEARLFLKIAEEEGVEFLEEIGKIKIVPYFKWAQETPEDTELKVYAVDNEGQEELLPYNENGVMLNLKYLNGFKYKVSFKSLTGYATPVFYTGGDKAPEFGITVSKEGDRQVMLNRCEPIKRFSNQS